MPSTILQTIGIANVNQGLVPSYTTLSNSTDNMCPHTMNNCSSGSVSYDIGTKPSYIAILSSVVSCLGSLLVLLVYFSFRDLRSSAQKIITYLAVADLISALGYIGGSINFIVHFNHSREHDCKTFNTLCEVQASITSWSSLVTRPFLRKLRACGSRMRKRKRRVWYRTIA